MNDKISVDDIDFDHFKEECINFDEWTKQYTEKNIDVYTKKLYDSNYQVIKVRTLYDDIIADDLWNVLHDHEYRKIWDENMIDGKVINMLDDHTEIGYYSVKVPWPATNRDFCNLRTWKQKDDEYIIFNKSITHRDCPEYKGYVRAKSLLSGYYFKKMDNGVEFIYYTHSDPKGWFPTSFINWLTCKLAPQMIKKLHEVTLEYGNWKSSN